MNARGRASMTLLRRELTALALVALGALALAAPAGADFGFSEFDATFTGPDGSTLSQAGAHPYEMTTSLRLNSTPTGDGGEYPDEAPKDIVVAQPPGFAGNPTAAPRCSISDFVTAVGNVEGNSVPDCPDSTAVGFTKVTVASGITSSTAVGAVFNLDPPRGVASKIGFFVIGVPVTIELGLEESPPYRIVGGPTNISQVLSVLGAELTLWGNPADSRHDALRGRCLSVLGVYSLGNCPAYGAETPFLTLPRACRGPQETSYRIDSWQRPGAFLEGSALTHDDAGNPAGFTGCGRLAFGPEISARPTSRAAASPTGLDFGLDVSQNQGLQNPDGVSAADIAKTVVTLPRGMTVNPSQAEGLEACTEAELARETASSEPGEGCPEASKIGTIEVETPLLEGKLLKGSLYVARPYENPVGSLIALYVVIKEPVLGIKVTQALKVESDPDTGQLLTTASDMPELPFSHFRLHFREGGRSPLISPPGCGSFDVQAQLYPSSGGQPVTSTSSFEIDADCPQGGAPFAPGFEAGTLNNAAGRYSPFTMRLTRGDGEQDMGRFSFTLPPGVVPKLAGIPYCSDVDIAKAMARQGAHGGQEEIDHPSCPAASQIGRTVAGAGVGSQLTYVPGKLYLAGPYHGDPISAVAITPAVAGPFDAGVVVVREALRLNPVTHVGEVDGSASDPIPHILKGIPLSLRDLRVYAERPGGFTLNPTSCEPFQARSTIWGDGTALAPLAPHPVDLSSRFQAAGCASLGFKPHLALRLRGGTKRGKFPALRAVYTPRKHNQANLSRLALTFPNSEFIEQGHFRTICTRVQFAAGAGFGSQCPKGSVYGHVKVWTPLLDDPLKGPVYLRSSNHNLPDAVFALHGLVDIELATRIDSTHGRLRAIVNGAPDAPVSRAVVNMQGGQKGLFVNSRYLCRNQKRNRARVNAGGQNGRRDVTKPVMRAVACRKHRVKRHKRHARRARVAKRSALS